MITPSASLIFLSPIECVRKGKKNGIVKEKEKKRKKKERKKKGGDLRQNECGFDCQKVYQQLLPTLTKELSVHLKQIKKVEAQKKK